MTTSTKKTKNTNASRRSAAETIDEVRALYRQGLYLDAFDRGDSLGPLETWRGPEARVLAARMASCLGAPRMGRVLIRLAYREHPSDPLVVYFHGLGLLRYRGPFETWEFMKGHTLAGAPETTLADWELLKARVLNCFRDFQRADEHLAKAESLAPERAWVQVEKGGMLYAQDRHEEALAVARHALELRPWYRPGIQLAAHLLVQLNRDDEALELLNRSVLKLQSGDVLAQLAALEMELELYDEAFAHYQEAEQAYPLRDRDKGETKWLAGRQSDVAYHLAKYDLAADKAELAGTEFFTTVAARLRGSQVHGRRVVLPVGFVRQHHNTCAPATLAAIGRHWEMPVDHLDVVQNICYDGTPAHSERKWANEHGFVTREFRVTWESTKALIDRGVPFTLTTVGPQIGHLQAVIGYDERRGTILIRDPSERHMSECLATEMIEHFASTGPRGMALAPRDKQHLLAGLELPDAELYDLNFALELALQVHERDQAGEAHEKMQALDAEHRLTLNGRMALARYDADDAEALECLNLLLAKYPEDVNLRLSKLAYLGQLGRGQERRRLLEEFVSETDCEPLFMLQLCHDLSEDARQEPREQELLKEVLRYRPSDAAALGALGDLRWRQQQRHEAFELYRLAACSSDKSEGRSGTYFSASRYLQRHDEALQFLLDRQVRFGAQSTWPARTLAKAYEQSGQENEALQVLDAAWKQHPDDGDFMLVVADAFARYGKYVRSQQILMAAESKCHRTSWLRANGYLASYVARQDAALLLWQRVLEAEPLACDAHEQVARLLDELQGREAALAHLNQAVERFPSNLPLSVLRIEWLREQPEVCEQAIRQLIEIHPHDAWAQRELAASLNQQRRWEDAQAAVDEAEQLEPTSPVVHLLKAEINEARGRTDESRQCCRAALAAMIDYEPAIHTLMGLCDVKADRVAELKFLSSQLVRHVIHGETIFAFCRYATGTLEHGELLTMLQQVLRQRPDLWQVWSALTQHLLEMERLEEADIVAREMVERFPLTPACWLYLSQVQAARKNVRQQIKALEQALEINPTWTTAARQLAEVYAEQGETTRAEKILRRTAAQSPREPENLGCLADLLWDAGRREEALDLVARAVEVSPGYQWGWDALRRWGPAIDRPHAAIDAAHALTEKRPQEPRAWFILAEALQGSDHRNECLQALDKVLELNPRNLDAYSMKAWALAAAHRFDEAAAVCRPAEFGDDVPLQLRGREAEIIFQSGDAELAIATMREVLEADPDYYWAWECLFNWCESLEQFDGCREAAEQLVRIAPRHEDAWAYLGDAAQKLQNLDESAEHFARAMELNNEFTAALQMLLDVQLERRDVDAARRALDDYPQALDELDRLIWQTHIAVSADDRDAALECMTAVCQQEDAQLVHIHNAVTPLMNADWGPAVRERLISLLDDPETTPHVAPIIVDVCLHLEDLPTITEQLERLDRKSTTWILLAEQTLSCASSNARLAPWGAAILEQFEADVRGDARTWSAAALVFESQARGAELIEWMKDWKQRDDLQSYMLLTLVEQYWRRGDHEAAQAIASEASRMPNAPHEMQIWLALYEQRRQQWEAVDQCLKRVNAHNLHPFYELLYQMLTTVTVSATSGSRYGRCRRTLAQLGAAARESRDKFVKQVYLNCQCSLARVNGKTLWRAVYGLASAL